MSNETDTVELPENRALILFDGDCLLCNHSVRFIHHRDNKGRFLFAPLQSSVGKQILEREGLSTTNLSTMVLVEGDAVFTQSDAACQIARHLTWPWRWLSVFRIAPRFLRDGVYQLIANNRVRWFGKAETCEIPNAELRERILG